MSSDGVVKLSVLADDKDFSKSISKLGAAAKSALAGVTAVTGAATAAIGGAAAAASKVGSSFEESMSQVAATMGITTAEIAAGSDAFELLSQAAKDAGSTTAFSASEASAALNYLALAGYDAQKASEALPAVLNLAAAGSMDLAYASDLATDAMAALGIEASNESLTKFGDEMARTASKANTSVSQLGEAILTVGGTAKSLAGGTTELNAALGVLANRGIKGSEGGTALRNIILAMNPTTNAAAAAFARLNLSAYDSEGALRSLNDVFQDLSAALDGMTEQEKTDILRDIFNKVDLKSAQALLAGCGEEFNSLAHAIETSGGAMQNMADTQLDNLNGDLTILKSGLEGLGISLYEEMQIPLRDGAQLATDFVSQLSEALGSGGLEGLAEKSGDVLAQMLVVFTDQLPGFAEIGVDVVQSLANGLVDNLPSLLDSAGQIGTELLSGVGNILPTLLETGAEIVRSIADGIKQGLPSELTEEVIPDLTAAVVDLAAAIASALPEILPVLVDAAKQAVDAIGQTLAEKIPIFSGLFENLESIVTAAAVAFVTLKTATLAYQVASSIAKVIETLTAATNAQTVAQAALTAVMNANPFVLIATVIATVISAVVSLTLASEDFRAVMVEAFNAIGSAIQAVIETIKSAINWFKELFGVSDKVGASSGGTAGGGGRGGRAANMARSTPAAESEPSAFSLSPEGGGELPAAAMSRSSMLRSLESAIPAAAERVSAATASMAPAAAYTAPPPVSSGGNAGNGQAAPIIVKPNITLHFDGDLASLARILKPRLDAEDIRVGSGV